MYSVLISLVTWLYVKLVQLFTTPAYLVYVY